MFPPRIATAAIYLVTQVTDGVKSKKVQTHEYPSKSPFEMRRVETNNFSNAQIDSTWQTERTDITADWIGTVENENGNVALTQFDRKEPRP